MCKVFISSTYLDNKERRKIVQDAITMAGMSWYGMEIFEASSKTILEKSLDYVRKSDIFVGIIGRRYGSIPPGQEESFIELEYKTAKENGKDCLMFLIDPSLPFCEEDLDKEDKWGKQKKLGDVKEKIRSEQAFVYFTETDLQAKVLHALLNWKPDSDHKSNNVPKNIGRIHRAKWIIETINDAIKESEKVENQIEIRIRATFASMSNIKHYSGKEIKDLTHEEAEKLDELLIKEKIAMNKLLNRSNVHLKCICHPKLKYLSDKTYKKNEKLDRIKLMVSFLEESKNDYIENRQIISEKAGAYGNQLIIGNKIAFFGNPKSGGYTKTSMFENQQVVDVMIHEYDNLFKRLCEEKLGLNTRVKAEDFRLLKQDRKTMIDSILRMLQYETQQIKA